MKHKILGRKSWEGTATMLVFSLAAGLFFVSPRVAVIGAIVATVFELLPEASFFRKHRSIGLIDDNLLVPLLAAAAMLVFSL